MGGWVLTGLIWLRKKPSEETAVTDDRELSKCGQNECICTVYKIPFCCPFCWMPNTLLYGMFRNVKSSIFFIHC
jgi:hypothetical protein